MEKFDDIEKILVNTPKPKVVESPHRLKLKYSLINQMKQEKVTMRSWRRTLAWAFCLLLIGAIGGWSGQNLYKTFIVDKEVLTEETFENPDGSTGMYSQMRSVTVISDASDFTEEKAQKQYQEIQNLISEGKGELLEVKDLDSGEKCYIYKFVLSDGEEVAWASRQPIGSEESQKISYKEIQALIAQGRGELIEEKELDSGIKVYIYKITRSDGTSFTFASDHPIELKE